MTLQVHLCGVQLLLPAVRDWSPHKWIARGSFARPLRLSSFVMIPMTRLFATRALAIAAIGASPCYRLISIAKFYSVEVLNIEAPKMV